MKKTIIDMYHEHLSEIRKMLHPVLEQRIKENATVNMIPDDSGLLNTTPPRPNRNHIRAGSESIWGPITHGLDRTFGRGTGYGKLGAGESIRFALGAMNRSTPPDGTHVDPNIHSDGCTIYMSDLTDVDTHVGFCDGPLGNQKAMSSIVSFCDAYRVFGTAGIQLSTGMPQVASGIKDGMTTSMGGKIERCPPIVLSAGNVDGTTPIKGLPGISADEEVNVLQGVAKGENTQACFQELSLLLDKTIGAIQRMAVMQGALYANLPITFPPTIHPQMPAVCTTMMIENFGKFMETLTQLRNSKVHWETMYCSEAGGSKQIASTNVITS